MTDPILPLRAGRPAGPSPSARTLATISWTAAATVGAGLLAYRLSPGPIRAPVSPAFPARAAVPPIPAPASTDDGSARVLAFTIEALDRVSAGEDPSRVEADAGPALAGEPPAEPSPLLASAGPSLGSPAPGLRDALASAPPAFARPRSGSNGRPSYASGRLAPLRRRAAAAWAASRRGPRRASGGGSLERLALMQAAMSPTRASEDAEGSSRIHSAQYEGAEPGVDLDARPIDLSAGPDRRLPEPETGGPVEGPAPAPATAPEAPAGDPLAVPEVGAERNVTPYQRLVDVATKLMAAAGLLLMGAGLLVWLGRRLQNSPTPWTRALGRALIAAGTALAYAALALGATVTAMGVAILASGQKLQGLIFTASGAALTYAAYKASQGDRKAHREARADERAVDARNREEAARRLESRVPGEERVVMEPHGVEVSDTRPKVEPVRSELPARLELPEPPQVESVTSSISYPPEPGVPAAAAPGNGLGGPAGWGSNRFDGEIAAAANRHGLDPRLLKAVVQTESSGNPLAVGSSGERGLMQLMPGTARQLGVTNPFDAVQSLDGGARLLSRYLTQYDGDLTRALAAYNAGPGNVARGFIPAGYVRNVLTNLGQVGRP